jgi:outer membrane protein insertion porin family
MMANRVRSLLSGLAGLVLLSLSGFAAAAQSVSPQAALQMEGKRLVALRVVDESRQVLEENPADLPLKPGQPFTLEAERDSLRQLFRTGRYADIVAEVAPQEDGLRLDFVVQQNFYVNAVTIEGLQEPPNDAVAVSSMRLGLGEVFHESDLPPAIERLRQTLAGEGLYLAKITYKLSRHPDTRQVDIAVSVDPGQRARAGTVTIVNQTPFPESTLQGRLKLKPKTQITSEWLNSSIERERQWLVKRGYLGARVSITRGSYDPANNVVSLRVEASAGLNVKVEVKGERISAGTLHKLLPIYEEGAVDEDLLQEGRRNLRDYLERQGYFDGDVSYVTSTQPGSQPAAAAPPVGAPNSALGVGPADAPPSEVITYRIERGARRRLAGIAFVGNRYFNDEILRSRVRLQPASFASRGRFSSQQLTTDTGSIAQLYQANGFNAVQVKNELVENYRGKAGDLFVRFHVDEGPQTRIAELKIEGNHALSLDELSRVIGSTAGQPYSDFNVAGDRNNVMALYYNQGFPNAAFHSSIEPVPDASSNSGPRVRLTYTIDEGQQIRVARVLMAGYDHTRPYVIEREIQLRPGAPLSEGSIVETQRRLYNLGIFNRVSIAPQNPTGTDSLKTIDLLVEEAMRYTFAYGLGLEAQRLGSAGTGPTAQPLRFSPRATIELTKLNLTGRADTLSFKVRASTLQGRALLSYNATNYFGKPKLSLQLTALYDKTRDVLTFTSTRSEGSVQLTDQATRSTSLLFRYVYRHVQASDLNSTITPEEIPLFSQPTQVSFFSVTWLRDRRDSPVDPSRGSFNTLDVDFAAKQIGSSASFARSTFQNATYSHIGPRLVFARSARLGIEQPVDGSAAIDIPLPERFFAGGGTTLRGFGLNQAGPRDPATGFPVGGQAMLIFNQQLQFPMTLPWIGNRAGGAVFYDAGNIFSSWSQVSLRVAPVAPGFSASSPNICLTNCTNQLSYFSHTLGFELRYHTPVGPVSIDLAYQLNPARFLVPSGNSPTCTNSLGSTCLMLARLPAFQFFVNLGSTF